METGLIEVAIIILTVVVHAAVGCVVYGGFRERGWDEQSAGMAAGAWPFAVLLVLLSPIGKALVGVGRFAASIGRRKSQKPETF